MFTVKGFKYKTILYCNVGKLPIENHYFYGDYSGYWQIVVKDSKFFIYSYMPWKN